MPEFAAKPKGRPKDLERRQRILRAARNLFLQHGMQAVSMDAIAQSANVSNRTVYSHFASKEELLKAVIAEEGESMRPAFPESLPATLDEFRDQLIAFGAALIRLLSSPNIVGLGRLIVSEAIRHHHMADQFYEWGPKVTHNRLAILVKFAIGKKWLHSATPIHAAQHLVAMWQGSWHLKQQLGLAKPLTRKQIADHATECVDIFLKAFGNT